LKQAAECIYKRKTKINYYYYYYYYLKKKNLPTNLYADAGKFIII